MLLKLNSLRIGGRGEENNLGEEKYFLVFVFLFFNLYWLFVFFHAKISKLTTTTSGFGRKDAC